jgi:RHS repeat-associated protein
MSISQLPDYKILQDEFNWRAQYPHEYDDNFDDWFVDYSHNTNAQFAYNANGAMTTDPYKGAQYSYNDLGMPRQVQVPAILGTVNYTYMATGEKLGVGYYWHSGLSLDPVENASRPNYTSPNSSLYRDYINNKVFEDGYLKRILLPNGYISDGNYYFYLRDHLGNNSAVAQGSNGNIVQRNNYFPYGKVNGNESFGQSAQPYKFGGKELETMHGLGLFDFEARQYDPVYGRFTGMDPLAEKYYSWSPYAYALCNPLRYVDPTGMDWIEDKDGNVMWKKEYT